MEKLVEVKAKRWWSLKDRKYAKLMEAFLNWRMKGESDESKAKGS